MRSTDSFAAAITCIKILKSFQNIEHLFWPLAKAKTEANFHTQMDQVRQASPDAPNYLEKIDHTMWVDTFARGKAYGYKTSKIVESMNNCLMLEREMSILDMLTKIWHKRMNSRFQ